MFWRRSSQTEKPGPVAARVEIYTWRFCPYCVRAKRLLDELGVSYTEYAIDGDEEARARMAVRSGGRRTLPQIFINGRPIGGYTELACLQLDGELASLLAESPDSQTEKS